jgi:hypothetical protein
VTWIASQTKLATSVATMQVVERGLISLDDDIREVLPRLKELKVIVGFAGEDEEGGKSDADSLPDGGDKLTKGGSDTTNLSTKPAGAPILEDIKGPITLR